MERKVKKCLVFDLDNTLWDGVLSYGDVTLKEGIKEILNTLDSRGILLSVASKNEYETAKAKLCELGIFDLFLCPQISWNSKSESIKNIADSLCLSTKDFAFIDDSAFERDEVAYALPEVTLIDAADYKSIPNMDIFTPLFITDDAANRRLMYKNDMSRNEAEKKFSGTSEEFLESLDMHLEVRRAVKEDLERLYELTVRTHQLNSTGYTYSFEELLALIDSQKHIFVTVSLKDKYGDNGKVGLALVERAETGLVLKLLIVSCRVMTRGVGTALLTSIINLAMKEQKRLFAEFFFTDRNRIMYITYKLMGFFEENEEEEAQELLLEYKGDMREYPEYMTVDDSRI